MTRLEVINAMLSSVGQLPVSTLDSTHPFVTTTRAVLDSVDKHVQAIGWWFNKDFNISLSPDAGGNIVLPTTVLTVDPVNPNIPYLQRGGKLYDPYSASSTFTDAVVVNLISLLDFEEIPEPAAMYIKRRAVLEYFLDFDGEKIKLEYLGSLMEESKAALYAEQMRIKRANIASNPQYLALVGRFATPSDGRIGTGRGWYGK